VLPVIRDGQQLLPQIFHRLYFTRGGSRD
jgi:hypothetical protein